MPFLKLASVLTSILFAAGCAGTPLRIPDPSPASSSTPATMPTSTPAPISSPTPTGTPARTPISAPSPTRTPLALFKVTEQCGRCAAPQLVMDAQGTLHLFWRAGGDSAIGYSNKSSGQWVRLPPDMSYANESYYIFNTAYELLRNPNGQACVMALGNNFKTNEPAMLVRCFDGRAWQDTEKFKPTNCAYAFSPGGQVRGLDPKALSENVGTAWHDCKFTIDRNGGYHAAWWSRDANRVLYSFSPDNGKTWTAPQDLADADSISDLRSDAQGNPYFWGKTTYRRWRPDQGWQAVADLRRYVNFDQYGIQVIKRIAPAPDGRMRALMGVMTGGALYYAEQLAEDKWSEPILITPYSVNADLVIDGMGAAHIAYDKWGDIYYTTVSW